MVIELFVIIFGGIVGYLFGLELFSDFAPVISPILFVIWLGVSTYTHVDNTIKLISAVVFLLGFILGARESYHVPPALDRYSL